MKCIRCYWIRLLAGTLFLVGTPSLGFAGYTDEVESDAPAFWWRLDEGPDEDFAINSGEEFSDDGTYQDAELGVPGLIASEPASTAVRFDGELSQLTLVNADGFNLGGPWEEKSVVLWFQADDPDTVDEQVIFDEGGTTRGLNVYVQDGEVVVGAWNRAAGDGGGVASPWPTDNGGMEITLVSAPITAGETYQVAMVMEGDPNGFDGTLTGYLNGQPIGEEEGVGLLYAHSNTGAIGYQASQSAFPGLNSTGTGAYFSGVVDEVALYNTALSADRILAQFQAAGGAGGDPALQPGDADQDLDFDQLDLVQVQIAAKYLSGDAATWGEGDWNGAPGGSQGNPPAGDGMFDQLDIVSALGADQYLKGPYAARFPVIKKGGTSGDGQTSLVYNTGSGELSVDAPAGKDLTSINITSAGSMFIGDKPAALDGAFDNFAADNVFKATFGGSFGSIDFGAILPTGLSEDAVAADLSAVGSLAGGGDLGEVDLVYIPEPSAIVLLALGLAAIAGLMRRTNR